MSRWAKAPEKREQIVLFATRLDDVIPQDHPVRAIDSLLSQADWSEWEQVYDDRWGQPAIPPRVICAALLYGMTCRIRASRKLEEALKLQNDFRWLVEGRTIDHSTLSSFRKKNAKQLKGLFVKICLLARKLGFLSLTHVAFDGTRARANNRRSGTRTPDQLREMRDALAAKYDELSKQADEEDARDFPKGNRKPARRDLRKIRTEFDCLNRQLEQLDAAESAGECPKRIPITDPDSRVMPNKDGGFAPNYTPVATVDIDSGLVVESHVLNVINEDIQLLPSLDNVIQTFQLETPPAVLVDQLNASGANLAQCEERGITVYSSRPTPDPEKNSALRENPQEPVPQEQWDRLPTHKVRVHGVLKEQLDKTAFLYDAEQNSYFCPNGKRLDYQGTTSEASRSGRRVRQRYVAKPDDCAACPLAAMCLTGKAKSRQISREQYAEHQERHAQHMATSAAQGIYKRRAPVGERPFAVIKQHYGVRRFLCRGLQTVRCEWDWAITAFNLERLASLIRSRAGPALSPHPSTPRR
jgi:transposase